MAVSLGLDDRAADAVHEQRPADQLLRRDHGITRQIERRDHCGCHESSPAAERWIRPKPSMWEADTSTPRSAISASSAVRVVRASAGVRVEGVIPLRVLHVQRMVHDIRQMDEPAVHLQHRVSAAVAGR